MKFKSKPVKLEHQQVDSGGSDLDIAEAMRSLSPLPRSSIHNMQQDADSDVEASLTKLPSPSPIRSADEDSGVGGSPGSSSRPATHNCNLCSKKFSRADILKKHVKTHVSSSCTVCGQIFNDKVALAKHQVEVHTTLDRVFQCSQCEKGFKEMRTLRLHLKIHNAEYPEQCGVCQKVFRTKWQLKQHQMDHGGERPYPCPECSFTCKTKQQLNEHRRKHSGEKAYSCSQCGTRFTYRNGLIKHTKLNRCPKKIITPEGETIIKKRSRTYTNSSSSTQQATGQNKGKEPVARHDNSPVTMVASPPSTGPYGLNNPPPLQRQVSSSSSDVSMDHHAQQPQQQQQHPVSAAIFVQDNQVQLHANGGTYGLALLEDGSLIATPSTSAGSCSLSPNVIAALSAATGLSAHEISTWAANLPAGSTVKVTQHHYNNESSSPASKTASSTVLKQTSPRCTQPPTLDHVFKQQRQQLTLEMASACHDSLISACVGLPSYQESFAVDPNEILSKDRGSKSFQGSPVIKQEPPSYNMMPSTDDLNNNIGLEQDLSSQLMMDHFNGPPPYVQNQEVNKPCSVINVANSRLLNMDGSGVKQEPNRLVQNILSDIDLDEFPDNIVDDMDICSGFNLNDQDFTSIKSIVEQTFKDGRDVLDIISAV